MFTFTIIDDYEVTEDLITEVYEVGKANPRSAYDACAPQPYASRKEVVEMFEPNDRFGVFLVSDDETGELCGALRYRKDDGRLTQFINAYYLNPDGSYSEKGHTLVKAMFAAVKERSEQGRVISQSPNPNTVALTEEFGAEVDPAPAYGDEVPPSKD